MTYPPVRRPPCPTPQLDAILVIAVGAIVTLVATAADQTDWVLGGLIIAGIGLVLLLCAELTR